MMYNNINMRLTPFKVVSALAAVLLITLLLLESYPTSAFRLSDEGKKQHHHSSPAIISSTKHETRNNEINNSDNTIRGSSSNVLPKSSLSSSLPSTSSSSSSDGRSSVISDSASNVISKRSLSSSISSSDPSSFRSHRHENSILNVAWPPNAMWGFLPSKKKPGDGGGGGGGGGVQLGAPLAPSSLHSQSAASSYSKKAISLSSSQDKSLPSDSSISSAPGKKKSASSDLFLDPVTLDEMPPPYYSSSRDNGVVEEGSTSNMANMAAGDSRSNSFFHKSASSKLSSNSAQRGDKQSPTPPPIQHYILLQPPTRIEPPLGNDDMDDEMGSSGESQDTNRDFSSEERPKVGDGDRSTSWLKRSSSSSSGAINRGTLSIRKRSRDYDVPQIECPPAVDGMERFACPSTDRTGRYRCVDDHVLCDGYIDCPGKEDEDLQACMFYKTTKAHLDVLADALLRWARG